MSAQRQPLRWSPIHPHPFDPRLPEEAPAPREYPPRCVVCGSNDRLAAHHRHPALKAEARRLRRLAAALDRECDSQDFISGVIGDCVANVGRGA